MINILFICHGNICRSPMAEFVLKDLVQKDPSLSADDYYIESAATSAEELGNGVYPPVRRLLSALGIDCSGKRARQLTVADYDRYDLLIGMDKRNIDNMMRLFREDPKHKIKRLLDYSSTPGDIADPWYSGEFQKSHQEILRGCRGLLTHLTKSDFGNKMKYI